MKSRRWSMCVLRVMIAVGLLGVFSACARTTSVPVAPIPEDVKAQRMEKASQVGETHRKRMAEFLEDNPRRMTRGVVFIGDSITQGFPIEAALPNSRMINRGIGGNMIANVQSRLDTSVADLQPSRIYLMIGINDLWWGGTGLEKMVEQYDALLAGIREAAPGAKVYAESTLPMCGRGDEINVNVTTYNEHIRRLAKKHGAVYVDLWPVMATEDGSLKPAYTSDGVHLTLAGNLAWMSVVLEDDREYVQALRNLAPRWRAAFAPERAIDAISPAAQAEFAGGRGTDQLIVYTPEYPHPTTRTNEWGSEVTVIDGVVTGPTGGNNSPIPPNGIVISGHGAGAAWINGNLTPGKAVELRGDKLVVKAEATDDLLFEFWHAVAAMDERGATEREWRDAERLIRRIRRGGDSKEELLAELRCLNPGRYQ
jgi:lysophospholipase L1-like esterase